LFEASRQIARRGEGQEIMNILTTDGFITRRKIFVNIVMRKQGKKGGVVQLHAGSSELSQKKRFQTSSPLALSYQGLCEGNHRARTTRYTSTGGGRGMRETRFRA